MFLVQSGAPIIILLCHQYSPLRTKFITYLVNQDVVLILFVLEDYLWQWLNQNSSLTVTSLIVQSTNKSQQFISCSHSYRSINSILIYCTTSEMDSLQRYSRSFPKIDGIYHDEIRLLVKLAMDLIFVSEELGDSQREDNNNELEAQRNYDRALKFCALVKQI